MKRKVQLVQVNYAYGSNVFLPYSVGLLQAYALSQPGIADHYEFITPFFLRRPVYEVVASLPRIDVLGLSCYIWNWEYSKALGQAVKAAQPHCLVVLGGTQVPHNFKGFARAHPWADALVFYEGEKVFSGILAELISPNPCLLSVPGIVVLRDGEEVPTVPAGRISDLSELPSPYINNVFYAILKDHPGLSFQASQETHRGCPYTCTFCDWGSATMNKVRQFSDGRIASEYQWFATHNIDLLYNCDANYGLFERDIGLTEKLVDVKRKHGLPTKFRAAYAKNSNQRVFEIARMLNNEGMCKGVTLSFQSLDPHTLQEVRRKNMAVNDFTGLMKMYRDEKIPTYTELILGLPGETYDSFANGIDSLMESGQHEGLNIYHAMLLPNSELSKPDYIAKHGIKSVKTELLLLHGTRETNDIPEYYDIVVETATLPKSDWIRASLFAYVVQAFHCLNLTREIAVAAREKGITYRSFYEMLISTSDGAIEEEIETVKKLLENASETGASLDVGDKSFGTIMWPVEEVLFLRILKRHSEWHGFIEKFAIDLGLGLIPVESQFHYSTRFPSDANQDWPTFAKEVVWYGRKGGTMKKQNTK